MKNLFLVGGNRMFEIEPLNTISKLAKKKKINLFLYTEKIHLNKKCSYNLSFKKFLKKNKINFKLSNNINDEIVNIKQNFPNTSKNFMLLMNCIWKVNSEMINLFKNRIFNIHIGKFPHQIGAGGASWLKMVNAKFTALTIHEVTDEYDRGRILIEKNFKLKRNFTLDEYYSLVRNNEKTFLNNFFDFIIKDKYKFKKAKKDDFTYMPRLDTKTHGFIDWSWDAKEIVSFIQAFGKPYIGASTFIQKEKFFITEAKFKKNKIRFHPYQAGIIFHKKNNCLSVAAKNGTVIIGKVFDKKGKKLNINKFRLGSRFYTPYNILDNSKLNTAVHTGKGIIIKN